MSALALASPPIKAPAQFCSPNEAEIRTFFETLWPSFPEAASLCIFTLPNRVSHHCDSIEDAIRVAAAECRGNRDVYYSVAGLAKGRPKHGRGKKEEVVAALGVWIDADLKSYLLPGEPPNIEVLRDALPANPQPTILVCSGNGWHAYWLFDEPILIVSEEDRAQTQQLVVDFQEMLRQQLRPRNFGLDATHDLSRVLRVPGTFNLKDRQNPKRVYIEHAGGRRYQPSYLRELVDDFRFAVGAVPTEDSTGMDRPKRGTAKISTRRSLGPSDDWWKRIPIVVNENPGITEDDIGMACQASDEFADTWHCRRSDLNDAPGTFSGHDQSLANQLAAADFGEQAICDWLVTFRAKHGEGPKRLDYYQRTIRNALESCGRAEKYKGTNGETSQMQHEERHTTAAGVVDSLPAAVASPDGADANTCEQGAASGAGSGSAGQTQTPPAPGPTGSESAAWKLGMVRNRDGSFKPLLANATHFLRFHPDWRRILAFNQLTYAVEALELPPWAGAERGPWTDHEDRKTAEWLQLHKLFVSVDVAGQAVQTVARERRIHPPLDYLSTLKWDGTIRLPLWAHRLLGAPDDVYTGAVSARWLISAVARIYQPGVKADCCLVLEGAQGIGKSTVARILGEPWFTDEISELGSKDSSMQTRGVWIVELSEYIGSRTNLEKVKAFMSRATDRFRPPYGRHVIEHPRSCVFIGTTNNSAYLHDETGGRRFWPIKCGALRIEDLKRERDQLWAEAVHRYRAHEPWWLDSPELNQLAQEEQADRYDADPWSELIQKWLAEPSPGDGPGDPSHPFTSCRESVTMSDILTHCIGKHQGQWTQADKNRVSRCLVALGWERYRPTAATEGRRQWRYRREKS